MKLELCTSSVDVIDDPDGAHETLVHAALLDLFMQDLLMSPADPFDVK